MYQSISHIRQDFSNDVDTIVEEHLQDLVAEGKLLGGKDGCDVVTPKTNAISLSLSLFFLSLSLSISSLPRSLSLSLSLLSSLCLSFLFSLSLYLLSFFCFFSLSLSISSTLSTVLPSICLRRVFM